MKKYAVIDMIKNGDSFENIFETEQEALKRADYEWDIMSDHDKNRREYFAVMCGELDDEECFDLNTAIAVKTYREA